MITLNLKQAKEIVEMFEPDDEESEITLIYWEEHEYQDDDMVNYVAPAGLYAYYTEYPEEGAVYLGEAEWK